jgi:NADH-quinone oxidoreductase subunit N
MTLPTLETINLLAVLPALVLVGWACVVLMIDLFIPPAHKYWTAWLSVLGLVGSGVALAMQMISFTRAGAAQSAFGGMLAVDGFALFLQAIFLLSAVISILIALNYLPRRGIERGEYYTLLIFTTSGMMFMAMASNLIVVFLSLELLSIPLYILSGFARPRLDSEESAMKYFLLGAFASGFLVYGIALVYGGTGTTSLSGVLAAINGTARNLALAIVGMGLILVGLGFKVAAVPFHMWTPDVYQGAPTPVTAFMSVGAKAGGFAALLRVLVTAFPSISSEWGVLISIIAGLTMILGNVVAISQSNVKRMLAYSSIAHAGYILVAVAAAQNPDVAPFAVSAAAFYLLTYTFTNLGAFTLVTALEKDDGSGTEISDFAGLGKTRPVMAIAMTLFMLSLIGLPPSAGMVGKFFVFQAAVQAGQNNLLLMIVTIIGVLTSVVSAFYYMRVVVFMYMRDGEGKPVMQPALGIALAITAIGTLVLGIVPAPVFDLARQALIALTG